MRRIRGFTLLELLVVMFIIGIIAAMAGARHFADQSLLIDALRRELGPGDVVLVKGSRSAGMERVVAALTTEESVRC